MKYAAIGSLALCSFLVACATEDATLDEADDLVDVDAKYDGPGAPTGLYDLIDGDRLDETTPRIVILDLRSDATFYSVEERDDETRTTFGTFKLTRDRYDNRYLRFTDPNDQTSWRWKFETSGTKLELLDRSREVIFEMQRAPRPSATFVSTLHSTFAAATHTTIADPTAASLPDAFADRVTELRYELLEREDSLPAMKTYSFKVSGTKVFAVEWGPGPNRQVEVFAPSSQLLAKTKYVDPLEWMPLHP